MTNYTFDIKSPKDKLNHLLDSYSVYLKEKTSSKLATDISTNAWHLSDWVFEEYKDKHKLTLGKFREALYLPCPSLKIMHDICNGSKHKKLSQPKASIKDTRKHLGAFSNHFSRAFDVTTLKIELEDGTVLFFEDEIQKVISFWINYFKTELDIQV